MSSFLWWMSACVATHTYSNTLAFSDSILSRSAFVRWWSIVNQHRRVCLVSVFISLLFSSEKWTDYITCSSVIGWHDTVSSEWNKRVHACIRKQNEFPKSILLFTHTHTQREEDIERQGCSRHASSNLNLKFRARTNGNDALYVEAAMSTCCTRFLRSCLLFFINYAILRLNVSNAHGSEACVQPHHHRVSSKPWTMITFWGFHMNVSHCRFLPCIIYWPLLMFALLFDTVFVGIVFFLFFVRLVYHADALDSGALWPQENCARHVKQSLAKSENISQNLWLKLRALKNIEALARTIAAVNSCDSVAVLIFRFTQTH